MSVTSITSPIQYAGNGVTTVFAFPYKFLANTDLAVVFTVAGVDTTKVLNTDFTVTGAGLDAGGSVTFGTAPANGVTVTIFRDTARQQPVDYVSQDNFPAETHETALDRLTLQSQDMSVIVARTLRLPRTQASLGQLAAVTWKNKILGFDANGIPTPSEPVGATSLTGSVIEVTSYSALRLLSVASLTTGRQARVSGYSAVGDGGGGVFVYDSASAVADDNGTVLAPAVGAGRWRRSFTGPLSVKWFGAKGDGATDDLTAIRATISRAVALGSSSQSGGGITSVTAPQVFFPTGVYSVTGDLSNATQVNTIEFIGERAIIELAAGITGFTNLRYMVSFRGISFRGGAIAVAIATGNVNSTHLTFDDCDFMNQSSRCVDVDNNSNSSQLMFRNCKFYLGDAQVIKTLTCDYVKFIDCWIQVATATDAAFDITQGNLLLEGITGVPDGGSPSPLLAWVELNSGGSLKAFRCRFGGEGGGPSDAIVINRNSADVSNPVTPSSITIKDSECYTRGSLIHFYAIPNCVEVTGCRGLADPEPIEIDAGISAADLAAIGNNDSIFKIDFNSQQYNAYIDPVTAPVAAREGLPMVGVAEIESNRPLVADLLLQIAGYSGAYTPVVNTASITRLGVADEFAVDEDRFTATADGAFFDSDKTTMLNGIAAGVYTAVFDVEITTNHTINAIFQAGYKQLNRTLSRGRHTICVPFYYDGGAEQSIRLASYVMPNGVVVAWQRARLFRGNRKIYTKRSLLDGPIAPVAGQWYRGDKVFNTARVNNGEPECYECFVAGAPGTWAPNTPVLVSGTYITTLTGVANVTGTTAYTCQYMRVGDVVTVSGQLEVDPTASPVLTQLGISLPIASNFTGQAQCGGTAGSDGVNTVGVIYGDAANNRAELAFVSFGTTSVSFRFSFTYRIL